MKVAVLADIHSNLHALNRVLDHVESWRPDAVIMGGDAINRGPRPGECWQLIEEMQRDQGWQLVRGNHEDYVLDMARPDAPRHGPQLEIARNALWTYRKLDRQVEGLEAMPFQVSLTGPDGRELRVVHASMRNNRDGIFPRTPDYLLRKQIDPPPAVLCSGHTHRPLVRTIDQTLVVNVGSVGMPFDGDYRAGYAQLSWVNGAWKAEIVRLEYDRGLTERDFHESGFLAGAGPLAQVMLLEFQRSRSYVHLWIGQYEPAVLAGEMSMADSVRDLLADLT